MLASSPRIAARAIGPVLAAAAFLLVTGVSLTAPAADKQTVQLEMKARESFAAGRYDEALQTFAKLYAETLHPVYLRNIGRCHQKMRDPQKAIDAFKDYLAKSPKTGRDKVTADERTEIEGYIKEMETLRDSQAAQAQPAQPAPVTPLPSARPAPAPAPVLATAPASSDPAAAAVLTAPPPAETESRPVYKKWWFWTIIGVAAVGAGVTIGLVASSGGRPDCPVMTCK
jgi:tetratricopeptide (TPR) repeat protein